MFYNERFHENMLLFAQIINKSRIVQKFCDDIYLFIALKHFVVKLNVLTRFYIERVILSIRNDDVLIMNYFIFNKLTKNLRIFNFVNKVDVNDDNRNHDISIKFLQICNSSVRF